MPDPTDDSIIGRELGTVRFPIERSKLRELAVAFHETSPIWFDESAAIDAGFEQIPLPPTFSTLIAHWQHGGALSNALALGVDVKRLLHGEAAWDYVSPVHVGDELTATARVTNVGIREGKRGGTMKLITVETEFTNQHGRVVVRRRDTLIETGATA